MHKLSLERSKKGKRKKWQKKEKKVDGKKKGRERVREGGGMAIREKKGEGKKWGGIEDREKKEGQKQSSIPTGWPILLLLSYYPCQSKRLVITGIVRKRSRVTFSWTGYPDL